MPPDDFATSRLMVEDWHGALSNATSRQKLERALPRVLTDRVMEHLPPHLRPAPGPEGITAWVDNCSLDSRTFTVRARENDDLLGLLILAADPAAKSRACYHIGYLLAEEAWGQGLATELVSGLVAAIAQEGPARLIGGVVKSNPASAQVLKKAGFTIDRDLSTADTEMFVRLTD